MRYLVFSESTVTYNVEMMAAFDTEKEAAQYMYDECFSAYKRYWIEAQG